MLNMFRPQFICVFVGKLSHRVSELYPLLILHRKDVNRNCLCFEAEFESKSISSFPGKRTGWQKSRENRRTTRVHNRRGKNSIGNLFMTKCGKCGWQCGLMNDTLSSVRQFMTF
ncbi:hypothetical protein AMECASPLE_018354 [Ameca splendens]|uniref:Uncharacterized protein n=1 Tax=Ameca splendens TaxID=208324 RepID=A0ABV0XFR7_9TELE